SFHGSNRDTCVMIGRSGSTPNRSNTSHTASGDSSRFFVLKGSMVGATSATSGVGTSGFTNSCIVKMDASYGARYGRRKPQTYGRARVRSMWHLHTHFVGADSGARSRRKCKTPAG